jgi:uncharacterized protein (DUF58 family)
VPPAPARLLLVLPLAAAAYLAAAGLLLAGLWPLAVLLLVAAQLPVALGAYGLLPEQPAPMPLPRGSEPCRGRHRSPSPPRGCSVPRRRTPLSV